jgi:hypothetical protein
MRQNKIVSVILLLAIMLQLSCASSIKSQQRVEHVEKSTKEVEAASEEEIRREMRATNRTLYGLGLGLSFGALGFLAGAKIGYEIDYANDIKQGCEDCGLEGLIYGSLIGAGTGFAGGMIIGQKLGAEKDREAAIQRIKQRQSHGSENLKEQPH